MAKQQLSWVTVPGTIANFSIGNPSLVDLLIVDTKNAETTFTFNVIGGNLPPGLTLATNGTISGTPEYSSSTENYFISLPYDFIVRALSSDGRALDGKFSIIINNIVNQDFAWVTPSGNLGTIPNGNFYSLRVQAESGANLGITYSFVSGELPPGMQLISHHVDKTVTFEQQIEPSATIKISNTQTISINDYVFGTSIPAGARVLNINSVDKTVTISVTPTALIKKDAVISFYSSGYVQGVPTILDPVAVNESRVYKFTLRATNSLGRIVDRSFSLNITNIYGPIIEPETTFLGSYFDGTYFSKQLEVVELNPSVQIEWSVISGTLPPGLSLTSNGKIQGYIEPLVLEGSYGPGGFDGDLVVDGVITSQQQYDGGPYQFNQLSQNLGYTFTVQAYDGANYDLQTYVFNVVSRPGYTADSSLTIDDGYLTVDTGNVYIPVIRNVSSVLPAGRQNSYYAYKVDGYDFDVGTEGLTYSIVDTAGTYDGSPFDPLARDDANNGLPGSFDLVTATTSNLPGIRLDEETGWLYGLLNPQSSAYEEYSFGIKACKTVGAVEYCSPVKYFTLPVLGDVNSIINWISPEDLGSIDNGTVSEIVIEAESVNNKKLIFTLLDEPGVNCRLPQGLSLLSTGEISGRATFEAFTIDDYTTTFDGATMTIDRTATFKVKAETDDGTASTTRTFTLRLNVIDEEPYENLYLKAMPTVAQRNIYNGLISNSEIFDPDFIYRRPDPYYGIQKDLKMLFLPGLTPAELATYQETIARNHYTKTYTFGDVKTAYVLDETYQVKYEVVYVEIVDPGETVDGRGPSLSKDLSSIIANPYVGSDGATYDVIYPNSSENMVRQLEASVGYQDQSSLPAWMTSNQPDPNSPTGFANPLGYTKAVVIAYANPNCGEKIAYRIKQTGIDFNNIEFTVDRYQVDNYYSKNYSTSAATYVSDRETTFDFDTNINVGSIVATVTYAVTKPYSQINGRPVDYINANGGIDGTINYVDGDTIIFAKQEQFENAGPYDGWVDYSDAYIGDNIKTETVEGFGEGVYDTYTVVPGFLEKSQGTGATNKRGGVWRINIVNGVVNLTFVQEITVYDRVRVLFGKTLSSAILSYSLALEAGQTVPYYKVFQVTPTIRTRTTFNNDTTKFFSYRDHYYEPGSQDKYVKFPQYGVFE
jgi:hypothetical protein